MTFYPNAVTNITVESREGLTIGNLTGPVVLRAGDGMTVEADRGDNAL